MRKKILPLRYQLSHEELKQLSPIVSGKLSRSWDDGLNVLVKEIKELVSEKKTNNSNVSESSTKPNQSNIDEPDKRISDVEFYFHTKDFDKSLEICNAILAEKTNVNVLVKKAEILNQLGKTKEAIDVYDSVLSLDPTNSVAKYGKNLLLNQIDSQEDVENLISMGMAARNLGNYHEALNCFEKALHLDPRNVSALIKTGHALGKLGKKSRIH